MLFTLPRYRRIGNRLLWNGTVFGGTGFFEFRHQSDLVQFSRPQFPRQIKGEHYCHQASLATKQFSSDRCRPRAWGRHTHPQRPYGKRNNLNIQLVCKQFGSAANRMVCYNYNLKQQTFDNASTVPTLRAEGTLLKEICSILYNACCSAKFFT